MRVLLLTTVLLVGCYGSHGLDGSSPPADSSGDAGQDASVATPPEPPGDPVVCGPNVCVAGEICCDPVCGACTLAEDCVDYDCGTGP
ncbi:MAG: hypothetical protein AB8I08_15785 [Sandaracinaceae bacterium]